MSDVVDELQRQREAKLPGWARNELATLRSRVSRLEGELEEVEAAAEAAAGKLPADDAPIIVSIENIRFGLPQGADIEVGDLLITLAPKDGIHIEARHLNISPLPHGLIWIRGTD